MSDQPKNPSAFPSTGDGNWNPKDTGMTLRDYFAAKALQGCLSLPHVQEVLASKKVTSMDVAGSCYEWADHMLASREAGQ